MKVSVDKHCHCIKRLGFDKEFEVFNEVEAEKKVEEILLTMKEKSCHTHMFDKRKIGDSIILMSKLDTSSMDF